MSRCAIGLDVGGTNLKGAVVDEAGKILFKDSVPTLAAEGGAAVLGRLVGLAKKLADAAKGKGHAVAACGMASPGLVDLEKGVVVTGSDNLPGWEGQPIGARLKEALGVPVSGDNDANLAAWGEYVLGAGRGAENFVFITIGTGIGGGIVLGGKLYRGSIGFAAEPGHLVMGKDGAECTCGHRGCLEADTAGPALVRRAAEAAKQDKKSALAALPSLTPATICDAARKGDAAAKKVVADCGELIGIGMGNIINILNPDVFGVGGGIADSWDLWEPCLRKGLLLAARPAGLACCRLVQATLGNDAGVIGAALFALSRAAR